MNVSKSLVIALMAFGLTACASGPDPIDSRTGQPYPASPTAPREIGLRSYSLNLFGQYRVHHDYLKGVNVSVCYPGANDHDVRFFTQHFLNREPSPAYAIDAGKNQASPGERILRGWMEGYRKENSTRDDDFVTFISFCADQIAGGTIGFSIRDRRSQTIDGFIAMYTNLNKSYSQARQDGPHYIVRGDNTWTMLHVSVPGLPLIEESEAWMLPIGDSPYYFSLRFGHSIAERAANTPEHQNARRLFNAIIDSFRIEKCENPECKRPTQDLSAANKASVKAH